jgi:hypothetical protein
VKYLRERTGLIDKFDIKRLVCLSNWLGRRYIYLRDVPAIVDSNVEPIIKRAPVKKNRRKILKKEN